MSEVALSHGTSILAALSCLYSASLLGFLRHRSNEEVRHGVDDGETAAVVMLTSRVRCWQGHRGQREVDWMRTPGPRSLQGPHFLLRL